MMAFRHSLACLALLVQCMTVCADEIEKIDHLIPPGYQPEEAEDEQGLWMEFEEMEAQLNKSALLINDPELVNYVNGIV